MPMKGEAMLPTFVCEKCHQSMEFKTHRDMDVALWNSDDRTSTNHAMCLHCWDALSEEGKTEVYNKAYSVIGVYRQGKVTLWYPVRERLKHKLMAHLNEHPEAPWCYDCGEYGVAYIRNIGGHWYVDWLKPAPLPDSLRREKERNES